MQKNLIPCPECGKLFIPNCYYDGHHTGKFCCIQCAIAYANQHPKRPEKQPYYATPRFIQIVKMIDAKKITIKEAAKALDIKIDNLRYRLHVYRQWEKNHEGKLSGFLEKQSD